MLTQTQVILVRRNISAISTRKSIVWNFAVFIYFVSTLCDIDDEIKDPSLTEKKAAIIAVFSVVIVIYSRSVIIHRLFASIRFVLSILRV